jgi:hypothetical protein
MLQKTSEARILELLSPHAPKRVEQPRIGHKMHDSYRNLPCLHLFPTETLGNWSVICCYIAFFLFGWPDPSFLSCNLSRAGLCRFRYPSRLPWTTPPDPIRLQSIFLIWARQAPVWGERCREDPTSGIFLLNPNRSGLFLFSQNSLHMRNIFMRGQPISLFISFRFGNFWDWVGQNLQCRQKKNGNTSNLVRITRITVRLQNCNEARVVVREI